MDLKTLETLYGIKAEITKREGAGISGRISFKATIPKTAQDKVTISDLQAMLGYHPAGYGAPINPTTFSVVGDNVTTWQCWASCD